MDKVLQFGKFILVTVLIKNTNKQTKKNHLTEIKKVINPLFGDLDKLTLYPKSSSLKQGGKEFIRIMLIWLQNKSTVESTFSF